MMTSRIPPFLCPYSQAQGSLSTGRSLWFRHGRTVALTRFHSVSERLDFDDFWSNYRNGDRFSPKEDYLRVDLRSVWETTAVSFRGLSGITINMSRDPEDVNKLTESTYKVNTQRIKMGIECKAASRLRSVVHCICSRIHAYSLL